MKIAKKLSVLLFPSSLVAGATLGTVATATDNPVQIEVEMPSEVLAQHTQAVQHCTLPYEGGLSAHMQRSSNSEVFVVGCGGVF